MKVGDKFAVTKCMPGFDANWKGESYLWNPLLLAIDQERVEIVRALMSGLPK